jgi:hypothetical protein
MFESEFHPIESHLVETPPFNMNTIEAFALESSPEDDHDANLVKVFTEANRLFGLAKDHAFYTNISIIDPISWLINHDKMCDVWKSYLCDLRKMHNKDVAKLIRFDSFSVYMDFMYNNYADDFCGYDMLVASTQIDTAYMSVMRILRSRPREIVSYGIYGER